MLSAIEGDNAAARWTTATTTGPSRVSEIAPADEGRHEPGPEPAVGRVVVLRLLRRRRVGRRMGAARPLSEPRCGLVPRVRRRPARARSSPSPTSRCRCRAAPGLEIRTHGLWADHTCETPLDHWSVGNEAFGLGVDEPAALYADVPVGDRVPLGIDLEWETDGIPYHYGATTRYEIPCKVHGEVLVGDERLDIDGHGQRDHSWGVRDWWQFGWCWTSGRLDDGTRFHGSDIRIPGVDVGFGYVQGRRRDDHHQRRRRRGGHGRRRPSRRTVTSRSATSALEIEPIAFGPALLTWNGKVSRFPRAMCRFAAADGRSGPGLDRMEPARHLASPECSRPSWRPVPSTPRACSRRSGSSACSASCSPRPV